MATKRKTAARKAPARKAAKPARRRVKPIPEGAHTVITNLTLSDCTKAITAYQKALGAKVLMNMPSPDGRSVWHAELKIGNSIVYCNDAMPGMGPPAPSPERPAPVGLWVWTNDCDAAFERAVEAGFGVRGPPADMFWGDRCASVTDPFGYAWTFSTHVKDMTPAEMAKAGEAFAREMAQASKK
jgi:uncharacterized glyoxalase superfamily protein PhnB